MTIKKIENGATLPLSDFMRHSAAYYYASKDPFGGDGDFITAPEISQIFGELIGLWAATEWQRLGSPVHITLLELGPGRGTLMHDALRAASQVMPAFVKAADVRLFENSPLLRQRQREKLDEYSPGFIDDLKDLPQTPTLIIANEFFDALPVEQYRWHDGAWYIRGVKAEGDALHWVELPAIEPPPPAIAQLKPSEWIEHSPASVECMNLLATHIAKHGGAMLAIDYGYAGPAVGDTVQALHQHKYVDVLQNYGRADITAHVDFVTLAQAAQPLHATLATQGAFLTALGGQQRLGALCMGKPTATQKDLTTAYERLIGPTQMGELFKVLILST